MIMALKYQLVNSINPQQLLYITLNHLATVRVCICIYLCMDLCMSIHTYQQEYVSASSEAVDLIDYSASLLTNV